MICIIGKEQTAQLNNKQRWCLTVLLIAVSRALEQGLVYNRSPGCYSLCPEPPLPTPCDHHGHMASLALHSSLCSKVSSSDMHRLTMYFIYLLIFISFRCNLTVYFRISLFLFLFLITLNTTRHNIFIHLLLSNGLDRYYFRSLQ